MDLSFTYGNSKTYAVTFGLEFSDKYNLTNGESKHFIERRKIRK